MYFYPGKTKTYTRTFNRVRALVFAEKQFDLFAVVAEGTRVPPPYNNRGTRFTLKHTAQITGVKSL